MNFSLLIINSAILILLLLSLNSFGFVFSNNFLKIKFTNFFDNFIIGIFVLLFYLEIHIIFFKINFLYTIHLIFILLLAIFFFFKSRKTSTNFLIVFIGILITLNSHKFPYYDYIYDHGYYYNGYINWLNNENIVRGIANFHPSYGYTGNSFLLGSFFNFYPFHAYGYSFTSSIFFLFYFLFVITELKFQKIFYLKIFLILSLYVVSKYIFEEPLNDYSSYKINLILYLYLFYKILDKINKNEKFEINFILIVFTLGILVTLSPFNWLFCFLSSAYLIIISKLKKNVIILIFSAFFVLLFFFINLLKSGHLLYPLQIFYIDFNFDFKTTYDFLYQIKNFPKNYLPGYSWINMWLINSYLNSSFCIIYTITFFLTLINLCIPKFIDTNIMKPFLPLFVILNISLIFWFLNSPDLKTGKVLFWLGIILTLSFLINNFFYVLKFQRDLINSSSSNYLVIFLIIISLSTSLDNLNLFKSSIKKSEAELKFPIKENINLNEKNIIKLRDLDYSNDIFTTTSSNKNFNNLTYYDGFFPKFTLNTK